jgi:hypothetical protein
MERVSVVIADKISEESFKRETLSREKVEMLVAVDDGLSRVLAGIMFSLNLNEELLEVINGHGAIL